mmetsp:Transcript_14508/g.31224  ORF Transcript_14508/g.31224 Transcript_14508/m.31224 type:complete len:241 (+) Transcript_14508:164-886(+)
MYHIMTRYQVHVILRNSIQHRVPWRPILPAKAWYYTLLLRIVFVPLPTLGGHTQTIHRLRHHLPLRQYLNQIPIRILHERQPLHPTGIRRLEKLRAHLVKSLARPVHVRDRDANVSESAANLLPVLRSRGIGIAGIVNFIGLFFLGAVVPREFDASGRGHAVIPSAGFGGLDGGGGDGSDEVDVEFPLRELDRFGCGRRKYYSSFGWMFFGYQIFLSFCAINMDNYDIASRCATRRLTSE